MSVRVTGVEDKHAMFDSVTGTAFGPVFDSIEDCDAFQRHLARIGERDPRVITAVELHQLHDEWQAERA